jgi:CRP-like cAMP-binding protein
MSSLSRIPFFAGSGIDVAANDRRCAWKRFDEGQIIVDFEDASTDVFFLVSGDVRILVRTPAGKEIVFGEMRGGQFFGELAAIDGVKRSANVTALTRCEIGIMPAGVFREIVYGDPELSERLAKLLTARVRELNSRLMEHAVLEVRHRLYSELLRLSVPRAGHAGERVVSPPPFHHIVAARIGCRREQVTREFSAMSAEGLIERTRGALVLKRPAELEARVAQALRTDA